MPAERTKHPFRRLLGQAARYRLLLGFAVLASAINLGLMFVIPWIIGSAIDDVVAPDWVRYGAEGPPTFDQRVHWLTVLVVIGTGTALSFGTITYLRGHYTVKLGNRIIVDLRRELFEHLQRLSLQFYARERTGSIMSRLINDIQQAGNLINGGVLLVLMDFVQILIALALLFLVSWKLTLATIGVLPLYALTFKLFNERVRVASDRVQSQISKISGDVQERLTGIATVKAYDGEARESQRFARDTEEHYGRLVAQSSIAHFVGGITETLVHIGTIIIVGYGSYLALTRDNGMSAGGLTRFLGYLGIMYGPVRRFADLNVVYQTSLAALKRVYSVLDITPRITEKWHANGQVPQRGEVKFENVKFAYDDESEESRFSRFDGDSAVANAAASPGKPAEAKMVLHGISFGVAAGECVAVVGPSGSGKSTLVSLLPRLYDVTGGRITVDGVDVRDYRLSALRQAIAIVSQDSFVFTGTIRDNLAYGRPRSTEAEVVAAATAANAHDFIMSLPEKYQTMLGERGVNLSGGQRQRLSIARALLKNPRILILDEATSALDAESEALVQAALDRLMAGRTSFIIAHRLTTVRNANRIIVLENGLVAEQGSHDELLHQDGLYARLVRRQFGHPLDREMLQQPQLAGM